MGIREPNATRSLVRVEIIGATFTDGGATDDDGRTSGRLDVLILYKRAGALSIYTRVLQSGMMGMEDVMFRFGRACSASALILLLTSTIVWAQATAQMSGRVTDESGAVLPGVTITVTQTDTGLTRTSVTDGTGSYVLPNLVGRVSSDRWQRCFRWELISWAGRLTRPLCSVSRRHTKRRRTIAWRRAHLGRYLALTET